MSYDTLSRTRFFLFNKHAFPRCPFAWLLRRTPLAIQKHVQSYNIVKDYKSKLISVDGNRRDDTKDNLDHQNTASVSAFTNKI